jgi:hypothetical protein
VNEVFPGCTSDTLTRHGSQAAGRTSTRERTASGCHGRRGLRSGGGQCVRRRRYATHAVRVASRQPARAVLRRRREGAAPRGAAGCPRCDLRLAVARTGLQGAHGSWLSAVIRSPHLSTARGVMGFLNEMRILLLMAAKQGLNVLVCMPNGTKRILLVSVMFPAF